MRKEVYNPLVALENYDHQEMLMSIMDDCDSYYSKLQLSENKNILDNIIYSGIWSQYQLQRKRQEKGAKMKDPYQVLGIGRNATDEEINKAYRALAKNIIPI